MANSKTIQVNLKAVADVKDVTSNIQQIQQAISKLKMPDALSKSFTKIFADAEKYGTKAAEAMASGFKSKGDVSAYTKNMQALCRTFDTLVNTMGKIDGKILEETFKTDIDPEKLKQLNKEIETLQNTLSQLRADQLEKVEAALSKAKTEAKSGAKSWEAFKSALASGDLDEAKKALNGLSSGLRNIKTDTDDGKKKAQAYGEALNILKEVFSDLTSDGSQYNQVLDQIAAKDLEKGGLSAERIREAGEEMASTTKQAENMNVELGNLAANGEKAAQGQLQLNSELDQFKNRITYFFGATNAVRLFKRAISSAFETVKDLDKVMTETAVVTNFSVGDMWSQLPEYTKRANELGVSIHSAYEAATIYYQQGLKTNEVIALSNQTLKMARIAGLDAATATDRMTNALRGFNMELNETNATRIADVYSKLAAISASNVDEISTAMTKVASLANNANMEFETTAAFLAQMIETTRESAETAGTALKTVVARFSEVKELYNEGELLGTDVEGDEIDVNKVSKALRSAGINLNEYLTGMKGLDDIFLELASKWNSLDQVQQRYIATMAAGSRQQSRFIAMMSDYGRTVELVDAANNANGASNEQYQKTLESLETKLTQLKNAWDTFLMGLANSDVIKDGVDLLTGLLTMLNNILDKLSGSNGLIKMFATLGITLGGLKIGKAVFNKIFGGFATQGDLVGKNITTSLQNGINQIRTDGLSKAFKSKFSSIYKVDPKDINFDIGKSLAPENLDFSGITDEFKNQLKGQLNNNLGKDNIDFLSGLIDEGKIQEASDKLKDLEGQFEITSDMAQKGGAKFKKVGPNINAIGTSCMMAGAGLMALASWLDSIGGAAKPFASALRVIAVGLLAFPPILKVVQFAVKVFAKTTTAEIAAIPIVGWIAGVITALVALGAAFKSVSDANSFETRMANLKQATQDAAQAADQAKDAYDGILNDRDEFNELQKTLEGLTEGTDEWKEALAKANQEVLQLLTIYPELAQFIKSSNGQLTITDEGWETLIEQAQNAVKNASANVMQAQINEQRFQQDHRYEELQKMFRISHDNGDGTFSFDYQEDLQNQLLALDTTDIDNYEMALAKIDDQYGYGKEALEKMHKALVDYDQFVAESATKISGYANAALTVAASDKVSGSQYSSQIIDAFSRGVSKANGAYEQAVETQADKMSKKDAVDAGEGMNARFKELAEEYDVLGKMTDDSVDNLKTLYAAMKGIKVEDISSDKTREQLAKEIAEMDQTNIVSQSMDALYDKMTQNLDDVKQRQFAALLGQDISGFTLAEARDISDFSSLTTLASEMELKDEEKDVLAKQLGAENWQELQISTTKKINTQISELETLYDELAAKAGNKSDAQGRYSNSIETLTKETAQNLVDQMAPMGEEAASEYFDAFTTLVQGAGKDVQAQLSSYLSTVDLSNMTDLLDAMDYMRELGMDDAAIQTYWDTATSGAKTYVKSLSEAITLQNRFHNEIVDVNKLIEDLGKGTATYEQVQKLASLGYDVSKLQITADGWKGSEKDIEEAARVIRENTIQDIQNTIEANNQAYKERAKNIPGLAMQDEQGKWVKSPVTIGSLGRQTLISQGFLKSEDQNDPKAVEDAINRYLNWLNSFDSIQAIEQKELEFAEASRYTAVDNWASEGTTQSIRYSAQNEIKNIGEDIDEFDTYVDRLKEVNGALGEQERIFVALGNTKLKSGFSQMASSYEKWVGMIDQSSGKFKITNAEESQVFSELSEAMNRLLNTSVPLSKAFWDNADNIKNMQKAAEGDEKALQDLQKAAALDYFRTVAPGRIQEFQNALNSITIPKLNAGDVWDDQDALDVFNTMINAANMTKEEIQKTFQQLGLTPIINDDLTVSYVVSNGGLSSSVLDLVGKILSSAKSKRARWDNPYDELYNLTEQINESLRTRNALERKYQQTLENESSTLNDVRAGYHAQIDELEHAKELQQQLQEGRLRQINNLANETYTDKDGKKRTFASMGVTRYATYDPETGLIQIDYEGLEKLSRQEGDAAVDKGKAAEAYISKLEELSSSYEDTREELWKIEDEIKDLQQSIIDSYMDLEQRVMDALINQYQKQIDDFTNMSDALDKSNNAVLDSLRESIDLERQIRDNTKKEEEIADMEMRLGYLRRDTSGAHDLEIMQLQEDLENARQDYTDTLIDQSLDQMQKDADLAAEQRAQMQQTMQGQLDIMKDDGVLWQQVHDLLAGAFSLKDGRLNLNSDLMTLLQSNDNFKALSQLGQQAWIENTSQAIKSAIDIKEIEAIVNKDLDGDGKIGTGIGATEARQPNNTTSIKDTSTSYLQPVTSDGLNGINGRDTGLSFGSKNMTQTLSRAVSNSTATVNNGDFVVNVQADLTSNEGIDRLVSAIKQQIYEDSVYRNVNTMQYLR